MKVESFVGRNKPRGICIVFELATDTHISKDTIQVPLELAKLLGGCPAYLITRPNPFQNGLTKLINVVYLGLSIPQNDQALSNERIEKLVSDPAWYEEASKHAAKYADVLMLFPHFSDSAKCARIFWTTNLLKRRLSATYIKLDADPAVFAKTPKDHEGFKAKVVSFKNRLRNLPVTVISAESSETLEDYVRIYPELKPKSLVAKNCRSVEDYQLSDENSLDVRGKVFLTIGRLGSFQKATDTLLSAWILAAHNCSSWRLKLVGSYESEFREHWEQNLQEAGLAHTVEWVGFIKDRQILWRILRQASVFVFPSRFEGSPLVFREAISAGCAVITTPVGDVSSFLSKSDPGIVPIDDVAALSAAMVQFASDESLCYAQRSLLKSKTQELYWPIQLRPVAERILRSLLRKG